MSKIHIDGLTEYQVKLLDKMWSLNTHRELTDWFDTLDKPDLLAATTLQIIVMQEFSEQTALTDDTGIKMLEKIGVNCRHN